jgi:DNA invertase Pin-like site-specific DNA recombinase
MSLNHPIPTALYLRMSDDKQAPSPDRQRSTCLPYAAAHAYALVQEYLDEGVGGDEIDRRPAFQRMLADAQKGKFQAILCDDRDRFGRFDSIDFGWVVKPLRDKGVRLAAVALGVIDWDSFGGRLQSAVGAELTSEEQAKISRRTLSGMLLFARNGQPLGGKPPYGYKVVYVQVEVPGRAPRLRPSHYAPDGRKAEVVRLIFERYAAGRTLREVSDELYRRGVASPKGADRWQRGAVLNVLNNVKYTGAASWGRQAPGKRHRQHQGGVRPVAHGERRYGRNKVEDCVIVPGKHEPIIDQQLFAAVQARLRGGRRAAGKPPGACGSFVLSKLLVCGSCQSLMVGFTGPGGVRKYCCGGYTAYGRDHCAKNTVHEKPLVGLLVRKLKETFLDPANLAALRAEAARAERELRGPNNVGRLKARLATLERQIADGPARLLELPSDRLPGVVELLRRLERERDQARADLGALANLSAADDLEQVIREMEEVLWGLEHAVTAEDFPALRAVLRRMLSKVVLEFDFRTAGRRKLSRLVRGTAYRLPDERHAILFTTGCRRRRR